jgi:hypothetical protein
MLMSKKQKVVWVGDAPVTPISAAERRRIDRRIKKKNEKLRNQYRGVHGKKVSRFSRCFARRYRPQSRLM